MRGLIARIRFLKKQNGGINLIMAGTETKEGDGSGHLGVKELEKDPVLADINKRIVEAFDIFDHDGNKTVDVR